MTPTSAGWESLSRFFIPQRKKRASFFRVTIRPLSMLLPLSRTHLSIRVLTRVTEMRGFPPPPHSPADHLNILPMRWVLLLSCLPHQPTLSVLFQRLS